MSAKEYWTDHSGNFPAPLWQPVENALVSLFKHMFSDCFHGLTENQQLKQLYIFSLKITWKKKE